MIVELWTDGSGRHEGPGGWGYVLRAIDGNGEIVREQSASGWVRETTSQRMEVTAVLSGLRALSRPTPVVLYTDSQYVAGAIGEWLVKWEAKNWRKVKNVDLWRAVLGELLRGVVVEPRWVKGHNGTPLNERCDELAGAARRAALDLLAPKPVG